MLTDTDASAVTCILHVYKKMPKRITKRGFPVIRNIPAVRVSLPAAASPCFCFSAWIRRNVVAVRTPAV